MSSDPTGIADELGVTAVAHFTEVISDVRGEQRLVRQFVAHIHRGG